VVAGGYSTPQKLGLNDLELRFCRNPKLRNGRDVRENLVRGRLGQTVHEGLALNGRGRGKLWDIEDDVDAEVAESGDVEGFGVMWNVGSEGEAGHGDFDAFAGEGAIGRAKGDAGRFGNGGERGRSMGDWGTQGFGRH